jgi:tetratricopeptide (TPR) repeat protein
MTEDEKIKIEPEFNHALDLWHANKSQEAIEILKKLDLEFPNQAAISGMIGAIYFYLEDWANSLMYYQQTAKLSPQSERASIGLFHSLWHHGRFDDALEEAERFVAQNGFSQAYALILEELNENNASD